MGSQAPYGYGRGYVDPQDASTWPSGGRTKAYQPEPAYPSQPLYPPPPVGPSRPLYPAAVPFAPEPQPQIIYVVQQPRSAPLIIEVLGGLFGFYGIGWLVGGYAVTGVLLLVGSFLLAALWAVVTVATVGVGLFCIIPIDLAILLTSTLTLNARLKRRVLTSVRRQRKS